MRISTSLPHLSDYKTSSLQFKSLESSFKIARLYELDCEIDYIGRSWELHAKEVDSFATTILRWKRIGMFDNQNHNYCIVVYRNT